MIKDIRKVDKKGNMGKDSSRTTKDFMMTMISNISSSNLSIGKSRNNLRKRVINKRDNINTRIMTTSLSHSNNTKKRVRNNKKSHDHNFKSSKESKSLKKNSKNRNNPENKKPKINSSNNNRNNNKK